jgi:hypothetical protein
MPRKAKQYDTQCRFDCTSQFLIELQELADHFDISMAEAIRRAVREKYSRTQFRAQPNIVSANAPGDTDFGQARAVKG